MNILLTTHINRFADTVQSPREWLATAHPPGRHVLQTADKRKKRSQTPCSINHPHRPPRTACRGKGSPEQPRVRPLQHRNLGELEGTRKASTRPVPRGIAFTPGITFRSSLGPSGRGRWSPLKAHSGIARWKPRARPGTGLPRSTPPA